MTEPAKPKAPADPIVLQRSLVYALTGLLCLTGLVLAMAFKDPCAHAEVANDFALARCHPSMSDRLPDLQTWVSMMLVLAITVILYEVRWYVRVGLVAMIGSAELVVAVLVWHAGMSTVLGIANGLIGCAMIACAVGLQMGKRVAWSYATAICGVLTLVFFFGSSKVRDATGLHLAWAVLPSLAAFLPATIALACAPLGGTPYAPFAKQPLKR